MSAFEIAKWWTGLVLIVAAASCADAPVPRVVSAQAQRVRVESFDPPVGARLAGPIRAVDGEGCGIGGTRGSLANATAALKEEAARWGVGFVKLTHVTKPYSGHDCYHQSYELEGLAYFLDGSPPSTVAEGAPSTPVVTAPPAVGSSSTPSAPPAPSECSPPCSPGYACKASVCVPECNPACSAAQICRSDRVCVSAPAK